MRECLHLLLKVLAIVLMLAATVTSLTFVVFLMAGGANSKPGQITAIKWMMAGTGVMWLLAVAGGVWAMVGGGGRDGLALCLAAVPIVVCIAAFVVMWVTEW